MARILLWVALPLCLAAQMAPQKAMVQRYCTGCHNDQLKSGGFTWTKLDLDRPEQNAEQAERVIRKVKTGLMPPPGAQKPEPAVLKKFVGAIEDSIDRAAALRPNPGRPSLHRLNRIEYANSVRDLLDRMNDENNLGPEVDENVTLDTKPVTITVKPLPEENKPTSYSGAVGNFSIEATLASNTVAAQDENTLRLVVKGKGNLPVFAAPPVTWPDSIRAFDPTSKEEVNRTVAPMTGSKSFDYVFTPKAAGHYTIPAVNFSWFDPATQTYKTAETRPLELQVSSSVRQDNRHPQNDVVIVTLPISERIGNFLKEHMEWILAALLVAAVTTYFWRQNSKLRKSDRADKARTAEALAATSAQLSKIDRLPPSTTRTSTPASGPGDRTNAPQLPTYSPGSSSAAAPNPAQQPEPGSRAAIPSLPSTSYIPASPAPDPLLEARQYFESGDSKGFYREINRAMWKAVGRKLELPASELNKSNSVRQLRLRGWDETNLLSLENILNECEMNLYTPAYDRFNMELLLRQTERILDRLA